MPRPGYSTRPAAGNAGRIKRGERHPVWRLVWFRDVFFRLVIGIIIGNNLSVNSLQMLDFQH